MVGGWMKDGSRSNIHRGLSGVVEWFGVHTGPNLRFRGQGVEEDGEKGTTDELSRSG